jgi:hypothetical protein
MWILSEIIKKPNNINNRLNIQYNTVTQIQQEQIKRGLSYSDALKGRRRKKLSELDDTGNNKFLTLPGPELQPQLQPQLRYPGS